MRLRYLADIRTLSFVGAYFCLFFTAWFVLPFTWEYIVPTVFVLCMLNFMVAIIVHNTIHFPVFLGRQSNRVFRVVLTWAFGSPASGFVPGHNLSHHKHLQTERDNTRTTKMRFRNNFLNQFLFFFVMVPGIIRTENLYVKKAGPFKPVWLKQYRTERLLSWIWKLAWLIIDWRMFLLFLVLPNMYAVWGIFGTNFWQHDGCDENHPYNHSRNFTGKIFNFLVCNNGYHGAHHMKPGLHWSRYPEYHRKYIRPHLHPNLDQVSLVVYLWKSCIWPGKRVDYLGNRLELQPLTPDKDWVHQALPETQTELV